MICHTLALTLHAGCIFCACFFFCCLLLLFFRIECFQKILPKLLTGCQTVSLLPGERSGSVVECLTPDLGAVGSSLTSATALCP